jgi:hypothetical protein
LFQRQDNTNVLVVRPSPPPQSWPCVYPSSPFPLPHLHLQTSYSLRCFFFLSVCSQQQHIFLSQQPMIYTLPSPFPCPKLLFLPLYFLLLSLLVSCCRLCSCFCYLCCLCCFSSLVFSSVFGISFVVSVFYSDTQPLTCYMQLLQQINSSIIQYTANLGAKQQHTVNQLTDQASTSTSTQVEGTAST